MELYSTNREQRQRIARIVTKSLKYNYNAFVFYFQTHIILLERFNIMLNHVARNTQYQKAGDESIHVAEYTGHNERHSLSHGFTRYA